MPFPEYRSRRSRHKPGLRRMLAETHLGPQDIICPLYVTDGEGVREESRWLPGVFRYSVDQLREPVEELSALGVGAVLLYGIPRKRDELARDAVRVDNVVCRALRRIREVDAKLVMISDVGVSAYTSHGHGGVLRKARGKAGKVLDGAEVDNDATLELLAEMAVTHARCGVDFVSPSASMDGQVGFIRETLDEEDFDGVGVMACSVRYRSSYAQVSNPAVDGPDDVDRAAYQVDPANVHDALREVELDIAEGADMVGVKPALAYLDVIYRLRELTHLPIVGFSGSGEYQSLKAAAEKGWVDGERAMLENLLAIKRAGAEAIVTFHGIEAARTLARQRG
ncbi:MAG: porphobilinogen synthase [Proteobacteria bacterium]|nr:MAG: porphobilinogen synthase [Pseudomonadota bacterium]PIE19715.1 MAG: porphobilinogen synthase [Pseudomonadota bacterium]